MIKKFEFYKNYPFGPPPSNKEDNIKYYKKDGVEYGLQAQRFKNSKNNFYLEEEVICTDNNNNIMNNEKGHVVDFIITYISDEFKEKVYVYLIYFENEITKKHPENGIPYGHSWWMPEFNLKKK